MSDLINELGREPDEIEWYHLAACNNMPINWFYDDYEASDEQARQIDQVCLNCPVATMCLDEGIRDKEFGVRGGVYLDLGRTDKKFNRHKTPEIWESLEKVHGKSFL